MSLVTQINSLATRIGTEFKAIRTLIGGSGTADISALTTTDKTSLVAAINEVKAGSSGSPADASETVKGIAEIATQTEVTTGTDDTRIVTPLKLETRLGSVTVPDASETVKGKVELATLAEMAVGTDALRVATVAGVRQERTALRDEILGAGVPAALDTLDELAAALADDQNFAATVTASLAGKQPLDADLTSIAGLASAADKLPYATGAQTWALTNFTAAGRALVDDADAAAQRTTLSVYSQTEVGDPTTDFVATLNAALA